MALRVLSGIRVPMGSWEYRCACYQEMCGRHRVLTSVKRLHWPSPSVMSKSTSAFLRHQLSLTYPQAGIKHTSPHSFRYSLPLLRDRSPLSIGAAAIAFQAICPTRLDLLHPQYRRLCRVLVDMDEWGQVELMELLMRYARTMLAKRWSCNCKARWCSETEEVDNDLQLLLTNSEPLFQSRNPAVNPFFHYPTSMLKYIITGCISRHTGVLLPSPTIPTSQDPPTPPPPPIYFIFSRTRSSIL